MDGKIIECIGFGWVINESMGDNDMCEYVLTSYTTYKTTVFWPTKSNLLIRTTRTTVGTRC